MIGEVRRLVVAGSVIVDLMTRVPHLPERGGDVLAGDVRAQAGGGFNVLAAAARLGLPAALAGRVGSGPLADVVRAALAHEGIAVLLPAVAGEQGFCVGMVEPDGERTFVTAPGTESRLTPADLDGVRLLPGDVLYVSGYDLLYPVAGPALAAWLTGAAAAWPVVFDPGPLVAEIPDAVLDTILPRVDILALNTREMALLSGQPAEARTPGVLAELRPEAIVLVRDGEHGTLLVRPGQSLVRVPAPHVADVLDTTGAGDTHTGAFLAELARGADPQEATRVANVAAALSIRTMVSAGGPTRADLDAALADAAPTPA